MKKMNEHKLSKIAHKRAGDGFYKYDDKGTQLKYDKDAQLINEIIVKLKERMTPKEKVHFNRELQRGNVRMKEVIHKYVKQYDIEDMPVGEFLNKP